MGDVVNVDDRNTVKKDARLTTGRKIILLTTTQNGSYQLELRDYSNCVGTVSEVIINQDHVFSYSITGKEIHFCLNDKGHVGRIDFLIICEDSGKSAERIKPFIEKNRNPEAVRKLTEEEQSIKERKEKALNKRRLNDTHRPMARSRSNYCNSVEQRSWKSSKSPNSGANSPNDSGVTENGTPESQRI